MGGNGEGRAGDGWVCSLLSLSRPIFLRLAKRVWVCGDRRGGGCLFVEISVCGGHRRLWSRLRCGSRWLLGCGIDESMVGLWKSVIGLWDSVTGLSVSVTGLWETMNGLCEFGFWWVWVCGYGFGSGGGVVEF